MTAVFVLVFVAGYLAIALEHQLMINKAEAVLLIGVVFWSLYPLNVDSLWSARRPSTDRPGFRRAKRQRRAGA